MIRYLIARLLLVIPTLIMVTLISFTIMHATPGSPLNVMAEGGNPLSAEAKAVLAKKYGLDKPLWEQYALFLWNAVHGDFGKSYVYQTRAVGDILSETFPVSLQLGAMAMAVGIIGGLTLGVLAAANQNGPIDYLCTVLAMLAISLPSFVMAVFLILIFTFLLNLLPTGGWDSPKNYILPTIALSLGPLAIIARYTRSSMIEVIRSDYVRTARAKGLRESAVMVKHVLKNALIPPLTIMGPMFAGIGTGSFFIESIFRVPGMGRFFILSMGNRDYPMILAVVLLYGTFLAFMNLIVDMLYGVVDPRIRLGKG